MILNSSTNVNEILKIHPELPGDVAGVISHSGKYPLIECFVSSQLDVDRMDYLSRDAYFTGATYGTIDMHRLLRSMKVVDGKLLCRASGVHSIESYLMSRYHMYFQVYYHPVARAYELVLESVYLRIRDLVLAGVPVDANEAAILLPICPDFPMPVIIILPVAFCIKSKANVKFSSATESFKLLIASISALIVLNADSLSNCDFLSNTIVIQYSLMFKYIVI